MHEQRTASVAAMIARMKTLVANVADLLYRQMALLVDTRYNNGLPQNLSGARGPRAAINHGLKAVQIAASAWTAEALKLTMPASVFSRSTECHNQDKVSMGTIAARDALRVLELSEQVAAASLIALPFARGDLTFSILLLAIATSGHLSSLSVFWTIPSTYLGSTSAAAGIALVSSIGSLGGLVGPSLIGYVKSVSGSLTLGGANTSGYGLQLKTAATLATSGSMSISGTSSAGYGVYLQGSNAVTASSGNFGLSGASSSSTGMELVGTQSLTNSGASSFAFDGSSSDSIR